MSAFEAVRAGQPGAQAEDAHRRHQRPHELVLHVPAARARAQLSAVSPCSATVRAA